MSGPDPKKAVAKGKQAGASKQPADVPKGMDARLLRQAVRAQFQDAASRGQDLEALRESLRSRFHDPGCLSAIDEEFAAARGPAGGRGREGKDPKGERKDPTVPREGGKDPRPGTKVEGGEQVPKVPEGAEGDGEGDGPGPKKKRQDAKDRGEGDQGKGEARGRGEKGAPGEKGKAGGEGPIGKEAGKGAEGKAGTPPALQDIALAATPGADGKLPGFSESLGIDLQKYGDEKAWHDAWKTGGQQSTGGQAPQVEKGGVSDWDRAVLVAKAVGKGAGGGFVRGVGELGISLLIQQGSKKVPYLSGFVEIAQIAYDPKGWYEANTAATWGKLSSGWSDAFGSGKDWVTRIEGLINLLDGVANVIGLLETICQAVASVLFVGGLISAMFGVGAALLAAAPFFGKAGLILAEVSALLKIAVTGLHFVVVAGRAFQILADGDADPATLAAKAESLEKNTEEWTKEFTKARGKKLVDKMSAKGKDSKKGGESKAADAKAAAPKSGGPALPRPQEPKGYGDRIKSLAGKAFNVATGGQGAEFGSKWATIKESWNQKIGPYSERRQELQAQVKQTQARSQQAIKDKGILKGGAIKEFWNQKIRPYSERRQELRAQVKQTQARSQQAIKDKGILKGGAEALAGSYRDAKFAVTHQDQTTKADQKAKQQEEQVRQREAARQRLEQQLHDKEAALKGAEGRVSKAERLAHAADQEAADARARLKSMQASINSKKTTTAGRTIDDQENLHRARVRAQRAEAAREMARSELEKARADVRGRKADLERLRGEYDSTSRDVGRERGRLVTAQGSLAQAQKTQKFLEGAASKPIVGYLAKDMLKQATRNDQVDLSGHPLGVGTVGGSVLGLGLDVGNEQDWKAEQEEKIAQEAAERRRKKVEELQAQYVSIPSKLPSPPTGEEAVVDEKAALFWEMTEQIGQVEFQKKTLQDMDRDAEVEKTGLDALNKLAEANRAQTQVLKGDSQKKQAAIQQGEQQAGKLQQSSGDMKSGPGAKTGEFVSFLGKLANLLGIVPRRMAGNAGQGIDGAQRAGRAVGEFGQTAGNSGQVAKGAKDLAGRQKQVVDQSNQKIAGSESRQQQLLAQQLAAQAELTEGKSFIQQGIQLSDKKKAEKEAEKARAQADYLAAKKRLLAWALMHEQLRRGEQASLDVSMKEAEQMLSGGP